MPREMKEFCHTCKQEFVGTGVLVHKGGITEDWRWVCPNCNHVEEVTHIVENLKLTPSTR